jgi:hypothetical protein
MLTRRRFLAKSGLATLALVGGSRAASEQGDALPDGSQAKDMITPAAQSAIDQGLAYLAGEQERRRDGSFGTAQYTGNVAVTSLAGLAFMAGGHVPGRCAYGKVVTKALDYVLEHENGRGLLHRPTGFGRQADQMTMYCHGFGTLFLAELHGMVHDPDRREKLRRTLKRAVDLIIDCQNREGGWRYRPERNDADLSVTVCQIMALRAARNAGLSVPKTTVDRCVEYVKKCRDPQTGGFFYQPQGRMQPAFSRTAAGVAALYCAGIYKGPEVEGGLRFLGRPHSGRNSFQDYFYFYGHYYAAQVMWTAGGRYWSDWYPSIREELLTSHRRFGGQWADQTYCTHYGTAMACIILQVPNNYLPILQK